MTYRTGGQFRGIYSRLFDDDDWRARSEDFRILFLALRLGRFCNSACLFRVNWEDVAAMTGLTRRKLKKAVDEAQIAKGDGEQWLHIQRSLGGDLVWIPEGIAQDPHITTANMKHRLAIAHSLADVPKCKLKTLLIARYPELKPEIAEMEARRASDGKKPAAVSNDEPVSDEPTPADLQRAFAQAYKDATGEVYFCSNYAADLRAGSKLLSNFSQKEILERMTRAFSGAYKQQLPKTFAIFGSASYWNGLVDANLKPQAQRPVVVKPLTEVQLDDLLRDYVLGHGNLVKREFEEMVHNKDYAPLHRRQLWAYFRKHFKRVQREEA